MKITPFAWRLCLCLAALAAFVIALAGCGGGGLNLSQSTPDLDQYSADYQIAGDTPIPGKTPIPRSNDGTINAKVPHNALGPSRPVTAIVVSTTLGTFSMTGTIGPDGKVSMTGTNNGIPTLITATFEGPLVTNADGTRSITGPLHFSNGQTTTVTLHAGPATKPTPSSTTSPFDGDYTANDFTGLGSGTVTIHGTTVTGNFTSPLSPQPVSIPGSFDPTTHVFTLSGDFTNPQSCPTPTHFSYSTTLMRTASGISGTGNYTLKNSCNPDFTHLGTVTKSSG